MQPENQTPPPTAENQSQRLGAMAVKNADNALVEPGEQVMSVVHRHVIGILGIYIEMLAAIITILVVAVLAMNGTFGDIPKNDKGLILGAAVLIDGFILMLLLISSFVYRQCRIIVTDKSLVAVVQKALFNKKTSRLSMANVEDVSAEQRGVLASIFNYGTLTIQTAGEEDNFIFPLCPRPNDIADKILEARQAYVRTAE